MQVFCNVGEECWPDDPMDFLDRCMNEEGITMGEEMLPWWPFEDYEADQLANEVMNFQNAFTRAINEALTIERG